VTRAIASAGASTPRGGRPAALRRDRGLRRLLARGDHATVAVHTKAGFRTFTINRGFVQSVNGQQLTVRDGTRKATYGVVTLTSPATARIRDSGSRASLSAAS